MSTTQDEVAKAYAKTRTETIISQPALLLALYERLALDIELGKEYINNKAIEKSHDCLQHAQKIVIVLRSSLQKDNFEGGEDLWRLYNTLIDLLTKANMQKDSSYLSVCQDIVLPLKDAWIEAVAREKAKEEFLSNDNLV